VKRYAWLAGAALLIIALAVGVNAYRPSPPVEPDIAAMPVLARNIQRADRIQIVRRGATLNLERRGQIWGLAQNGGYPVKPGMADRLLDQLLALRLSHPSAPGHSGLRADDPADAQATLTGVRILATDGAGLGALIVADHGPEATNFAIHPLGDPRDWQADGRLEVPADKMEWVDTRILPLDPAQITGAAVSRGSASFTLDGADAGARLRMLQALVFTDVLPAAQMRLAETGRLVFALADGGALTVSVHVQADQLWLVLQATVPGALNIPPGDWVFRYPADAVSLLQAPA
jgi:hypothetical protein